MKSRAQALRDYVLRRLLLMVPTFIGVTFATFLLCQFVPGGQIDQMRMRLAGAADAGEVGQRGASAREQLDIPDEQLAKLREFYGFDKPLHVAYGSWLLDTLRLDLGSSFRYNEPVTTVIAERLPVSIYYGLITALFTYGLCIPLGILKAIRHRTRIDTLTSVLIFVGYAVPGFALGAVLSNLFAVHWPIFPLGGFMDTSKTLGFGARALDVLWHSVLPLVAYLAGSFAVTTMLMKNSLIENMSADYVKTALAKGLSWRRAIFVHALRNSLIPMATTVGSLLGIFLTGSFLIERVFNIPGIGLLAFEAIQTRDFPVVLGFLVISSVLLMLGNLLSDLAVAFVDPRVRFE
jgi:microcin C transport system permease protein